MPKSGLEYLRSGEKRMLDVLGGVAAMGVIGPFGVAAALLSAIDTKSVNPLLPQKRLGGHGEEEFTAWKLRTLPEDLGAYAPGQTFGTFDPRASRIGQLIRRSGLDETPQILNVITGDMSMVGPRPLLMKDLERYEAADPQLFTDWYEQYGVVRSGITGESQIYRHGHTGMTDEVFCASMRMDIKYFDTATLKQDIGLLASTPRSMVKANVGVAGDTL